MGSAFGSSYGNTLAKTQFNFWRAQEIPGRASPVYFYALSQIQKKNLGRARGSLFEDFAFWPKSSTVGFSNEPCYWIIEMCSGDGKSTLQL